MSGSGLELNFSSLLDWGTLLGEHYGLWKSLLDL